ncbi:MAG: HipA domain-containing protein [Defluviitaleaceae bacterium]|nr:HipA domain-containing protein [Defluviitaleaceae bacterium]
MTHTLMHQKLKVADVILNSSHRIDEIVTVYDEERLPIGTKTVNGKPDKQMLNVWWSNRRIPLSRSGLKDHLEREPFLTPDVLQMKSWGLSLSDHYWMNPVATPLNWDEINFFDNAFSEDVGHLLMGEKHSKPLDLVSPDNTSDGWLKKKWKIMDGKRYLVKAGSSPAYQEPYNEAIASLLMDRLGIDHIPYHVVIEDDFPYSVCENFVTRETELVSAWYVMQGTKRPNHVSLYEHYIACCEAQRLTSVREEIDKMIVVDYLMVNEDRHQNNFGLIRDVKTLKFIGVAPIFDTGTALWFDQFTHMMGSTKRLACKPFKSNHENQLKLVTSFNWLKLEQLSDIEDEIRALFIDSLYIDETRREQIIDLLKIRISKLKTYVEQFSKSVDDVKDDVTQNMAYSGK